MWLAIRNLMQLGGELTEFLLNNKKVSPKLVRPVSAI
jgi:hypothetical protein